MSDRQERGRTDVVVRRPDVLDEVFDAEAVVVNLRTGHYFALDEPATAIWRGVTSGEDWEATAARHAEAHGLAPDRAREQVGTFLRELARHELVYLEGPPVPEVPPGADEPGAPGLQVFTDMEDLLLLDPIHDIDLDGTGWPQAQQPATG